MRAKDAMAPKMPKGLQNYRKPGSKYGQFNAPNCTQTNLRTVAIQTIFRDNTADPLTMATGLGIMSAIGLDI